MNLMYGYFWKGVQQHTVVIRRIQGSAVEF